MEGLIFEPFLSKDAGRQTLLSAEARNLHRNPISGKEHGRMKWFRLEGLGRVALMAIGANQIALMVSALAGAKITPILAIVATTVYAYWDFILLPRMTSLISDEPRRTAVELRQRYVAGFIFGLPLLWFALPRCAYSAAQETSGWGILNIIFVGEIVGVCLLFGLRGLSFLAVTQSKKPNDP